MRKIIAIVKDNPVLKEKFEAIDALEKDLKERIDFIKRQAEKVIDEAEAKKKALWSEIDATCETQGLLPEDYVSGKYHKHHDEQLGVLLACNEVDGSPPFIQMLMGKT